MVVYNVYRKSLTPLVEAEFMYETSPIIAGTEDLSVLVTFKFKSDNSVKSRASQHHVDEANGTLEGDLQANKSVESQGSGWFGSRLSSQLSNATRSLFLNHLESVAEDSQNDSQHDKSNSVELYLGYAQILGHYSVNDAIIDFDIFKDLQKSTILEGKLAGIHGLEVGKTLEPSGILSALGSMYNSELNSVVNYELATHMHVIPFYSTTQNIIFSELHFSANKVADNVKEQTRSFYINAKLPRDLVPSFKSEAIQITYNLVFGYQIMENNQLTNKTVFVPLKLQPYIDKYARQPIYHLETTQLNSPMEDVKILEVTTHPSILKHNDIDNATLKGRRISFWKIKDDNKEYFKRPSTATTFDDLKRMSVSDIKGVKGTKNIESFMDILEKLNAADVTDVSNIQEEFEKQFSDAEMQFNVRENLIQILGDLRHLKYPNEKNIPDFGNAKEYEFLIPRDVQTKFCVKQNHHMITSLCINKGLFKVGDSISLNLSFLDAKYKTTGIEIQLLKHQKFFREEYLKLNSYDSVNPLLNNNNTIESVLYEELASTFNTTNFNTNIPIPIETESQFKANFFSVTYYVQVKFIINDAYNVSKEEESLEDGKLKLVRFDLKKIFVDAKGSILYQAEDSIGNANEFVVRIPIIILPKYEHDFGQITAD